MTKKLVGEFYGERAAGIIDPVVASRQGSTNERPTGDYWNPRQEFRETALMAANLSLLEQGKLSEEEVLRQYDGMYLAGAKIEDLYKTLGRKLGRIKYGEVERRDAIDKRAKMTTVAESQSSATTEEVRDAHRFVVDSRAQIVQQAAVLSESRVDTKKGKRIKIACALGVASILVSSCAPVIVDMNTVTPDVPIVETVSPGGTSTTEAQSPTETRIPTNTVVPTETATPTPEYGIDMEKFHNFPESYDYLLSHLDEFVQAPDPLTDKAAFDRWWDGELIPALGPVEERPLTADTADNSESIYGYSAINFPSIPLIGKPNFFYFENDGTVYPVPCMNFSNKAYPGITKMTMCVALHDHVSVSRANTNSLEMFQSPTDFSNATIMYDLHIFFQGVDWGRLEQLVPALGKDYLDYDNWVVFGFGSIIFDRNY